jgi:hypothetical protein
MLLGVAVLEELGLFFPGVDGAVLFPRPLPPFFPNLGGADTVNSEAEGRYGGVLGRVGEEAVFNLILGVPRGGALGVNIGP